MRSPRALLLLVVTLLASLVAVPATASASSERRGPARTTLVLRLPGPCADCRFYVQTGRSGRTIASGTRTTPGDLVFRVPTKATRRMSIVFTNASSGGDIGGASVVTFRFRGLPVGYVPPEEEMLPSEASSCWKGTRKRRVVLDLVLTANDAGMGAWVLRQQAAHPLWIDSDAGVTTVQETAGLCDPAYF